MEDDKQSTSSSEDDQQFDQSLSPEESFSSDEDFKQTQGQHHNTGFICIVKGCTYYCDSEKSAVGHLNVAHIHPNTFMLCEVCNKAFGKADSIVNHRRQHKYIY